jgi:hypothetical protein
VKLVRSLVLSAALAWCGGAFALPVAPEPWSRGLLPAQMVCGPYRCFRRPLWRYGTGRGFFPLRRFGPPPARRFYYRPFGFRRFGGFPR